MSSLKSMTCPTCGAPLTITGNEAEVTCAYCGNMVAVPPEMRTAPAAATPAPFMPSPAPSIHQPTFYSYSPPVTRRRSPWALVFSLAVVVILFAVMGYVVTMMNTGSSSNLVGAIGAAISGSTSLQPFFGGDGTGAGLFTDPRDMVIDGKGYIYVSDWKTGRIQRFDSSGQYVSFWQALAQNGYGPNCLAADRTGNIYACMDENLFKFDGVSGKQLDMFTGGANPDYIPNAYTAAATLLNGDVMVYAEASFESSVVELSPNGSVIQRFPKMVVAQEPKTTTVLGQELHLALDGLGNMYFLDTLNDEVLHFSADGTFINRFGSRGDQTGQFTFPEAIAVDSQSQIYVSDSGQIKVFSNDGRYLTSYQMPSGVYSVPAMAFDASGALYALGYDKKVYKLKIPGKSSAQ